MSEATPKFKVGDRVKVTHKCSWAAEKIDGGEATIKASGNWSYDMRQFWYTLEGLGGGIWEEELTLIPERKLPTFPSARINREEGLVITHGEDIGVTIPPEFVSRYFEVEDRGDHKSLYVELLVSDIAFDSNAKKVD